MQTGSSFRDFMISYSNQHALSFEVTREEHRDLLSVEPNYAITEDLKMSRRSATQATVSHERIV